MTGLSLPATPEPLRNWACVVPDRPPGPASTNVSSCLARFKCAGSFCAEAGSAPTNRPAACWLTAMARSPSDFASPIEPMLAKGVDELPQGGSFLFEPKWDGFRAIVFRIARGVIIQSRDLRPLDRYFPELHRTLAARLPAGCIVDGEIVIATSTGLDFDALQQRLHPATSRVAKLSIATPASFVAFDLLALKRKSMLAATQRERRMALEKLLTAAEPPLYLTPATTDRDLAVSWLRDFEGAGLDGVMAKPWEAPYQPGKRAMLKIKHQRTADCVVAGLRWHKSTQEGGPQAVGSLLLGLYDDRGRLNHAGITASFTMVQRRALVAELLPLQRAALDTHPWRDWTAPGAQASAETRAQRQPGATSRWSAGKDLSWVPLRPERVCEVRYDHLQGDRFRHATTFVRWRPDRSPQTCRYDQLEVAPPYELKKVFGVTPHRTPDGAGRDAR
jgi:ATP-dependent DNA ligase